MKITVRKVYISEDGDEMHFVKIENAPTFSHRVIVNRRQIDWLSAQSRPSEATAAFFFDKHAEKIKEQKNIA